MKIFNQENNQEIVYIQRNDVGALSRSDDPIPAAIYNELIDHGVIIIDDSNRDDFISFSDQHVIDFVRNQDWIIDYKALRNQDEETIIEIGKKALAKANELAVAYNETDPSNKEKRSVLLAKRELMLYKAKSIAEIIWLKQGKKELPFPLVSDSDGYQISESNNGINYTFAETLDPYAYIVYREDGKVIYDYDEYQLPIIKKGLAEALTQKTAHHFFLDDYEMQANLSSDGKYLLIKYMPPKKSFKDTYKGFVKKLTKNNK